MSVDPIRDYLCAIGKTPLLNGNEELELARAIQSMLLLLPAENPTAEEKSIIHQGRRAKNRLIQSNLRLVVTVSKKYQNRGLDLLDLIQEGNIGLERAALKYDPTKGYKFSTYAYWWIRQGMTRALQSDTRTIRLPIHIQERLSKVKTTTRRLAEELGRPPNGEELSSALEMTPAELRTLMAQQRQCASLDATVGQEQETRLGDLIPDMQQLQQVEVSVAREECQQYLTCLNDREREVIMLRYGLEDGQQRTLAEVGESFGFTRERARQIELKAMKKMRKEAIAAL